MTISPLNVPFAGKFSVKADYQDAVRIAQETVGDDHTVEPEATGFNSPVAPSLRDDSLPGSVFVQTGSTFTVPEQFDAPLKQALNRAGITFNWQA